MIQVVSSTLLFFSLELLIPRHLSTHWEFINRQRLDMSTKLKTNKQTGISREFCRRLNFSSPLRLPKTCSHKSSAEICRKIRLTGKVINFFDLICRRNQSSFISHIVANRGGTFGNYIEHITFSTASVLLPRYSWEIDFHVSSSSSVLR